MSNEFFPRGLPLSSYRDRVNLTEKYTKKAVQISSKKERYELIGSLLDILSLEEKLYENNQIPDDYHGKRNLLRALFNIRPPSRLNKNFIDKIDRLLQDELGKKVIQKDSNLSSVAEMYPDSRLKYSKNLFLWKGDISCLDSDAIVNAANDGMLGCFQPLHNCIDNVIHSAAGPLLREDCKTIMDIQGARERTGDAKITRAYNLPSRYVLHTVGPIITEKEVPEFQQEQLASCYKSCLSLAARIKEIKSIAFPCISTGVFNFPQGLAAEIAVRTVDEWLGNNDHKFTTIIFNVFLEEDFTCYARIFRG